MKQKILQILLCISAIVIIYFNQDITLQISIGFILFTYLLNRNYYCLISIIPLFWLYPNYFIIYSILAGIMIIINIVFENNKLRESSYVLIIVILFCYFNFIENIETQILLPFVFCLIGDVLINGLIKQKQKEMLDETIMLFVSIISVNAVDLWLLFVFILIQILIIHFLYEENFLPITTLLFTIYAVYISKNYIYIFLQFFAYLSYFLKNRKGISYTNNDLEFLLDDMNENVSSFCTFMNDFSNENYDSQYEFRLSSSIQIIIECFCMSCKNKSYCFTTRKLDTYIYIKNILCTQHQLSNQNGIENHCLYYTDMRIKAKDLQKKYELLSIQNVNYYKFDGICSSVQNYFLSLFQKVSPEVLHILGFKKHLLQKQIKMTNYTQNIFHDNLFEITLRVKNEDSALRVIREAKTFFSNINVQTECINLSIKIYPKRKYKVLYDSATLSHNNCQLPGDNFIFKTMNQSNFICALSDGMGSGYQAYKLSQETLKMVDKVTNCRIDFETSLDILNNFFKTRQLNDAYATLDFVDINLHSGSLNLYKMGSSTTFISRNQKIIPIYNNSLPFGINDFVTKDQFTLLENDLIIMVSDGISDYIDEEKLINYIEKLQNESCHKIVYEILQKIYYENQNQIKDDMSCIAIKLQKA